VIRLLGRIEKMTTDSTGQFDCTHCEPLMCSVSKDPHHRIAIDCDAVRDRRRGSGLGFKFRTTPGTKNTQKRQKLLLFEIMIRRLLYDKQTFVRPCTIIRCP
jgi:hypothetical protein